MRFFIILLVTAFPLLVHASIEKSDSIADDGSNVFYQNKNVKDCFKTSSILSVVQSCMLQTAEETKNDYEKEYSAFLKKIKNTPKDDSYLLNYNDFLSSITTEKMQWDNYIKAKCLARAYLSTKGSYDFYIVKGACLTYEYSERASYYIHYQKLKDLASE